MQTIRRLVLPGLLLVGVVGCGGDQATDDNGGTVVPIRHDGGNGRDGNEGTTEPVVPEPDSQ